MKKIFLFLLLGVFGSLPMAAQKTARPVNLIGNWISQNPANHYEAMKILTFYDSKRCILLIDYLNKDIDGQSYTGSCSWRNGVATITFEGDSLKTLGLKSLSLGRNILRFRSGQEVLIFAREGTPLEKFSKIFFQKRDGK